MAVTTERTAGATDRERKVMERKAEAKDSRPSDGKNGSNDG
ncbi:hypothetical protein [Lysinibacillus sp. NPDC056232]